MVIPVLEKKVRPQTSEGIPIPMFVGWTIEYFNKNIRPMLVKKCNTFFINYQGTAAADKTLLEWMVYVCADVIPDRYITCSEMRRLIPTMIFEHNIKVKGMSIFEVENTLAFAMNTGSHVRDTFRFYKR